MPEPDLVHYLDGEADPAAAIRVEAGLRADPRIRAEAIALLRQRALLAVVLAEGRGRAPAYRRQRPLRWLLPLAAAAGLVVAGLALLRGRDPAPVMPIAMPDPPAPAPVAAAFAPGTTSAGSGRPVDLADGSRILLAIGAQLAVPADGGAWRLQRGSLVAELPVGASLLQAGIRTAEAEIMPGPGRLEVRCDADGSQVLVAAGGASLRDRLTGASRRAEPGRAVWIPADAEAAREGPDAHGAMRGTVVSVEADGRAVVLATRFGERRLTPFWSGEGRKGQLDPAMRRRLATLAAGDRVVVDWLWSEHLRIRELRVIVPDLPPATDAGF